MLKFSTPMFRRVSTQINTPLLAGGFLKVHIWLPMDRKTSQELPIAIALAKSKFNKALVGHASLELAPKIPICPTELPDFKFLLNQTNLHPANQQYIKTILEHPEKKFPLYLSIWMGEEQEDASNTGFKPGQNNSSLQDDIELQDNRIPLTTILSLSEEEMKRVYLSSLKTICSTLQIPPQINWGVFNNCSDYVFDTLMEAGIVQKHSKNILTPKKLHDIVQLAKHQRESATSTPSISR